MKPRVWKEGEWWVGVSAIGMVAYFRRWDTALRHALDVRGKW